MSNLPSTLGKYQVQKVLGQGAMGIVYQAFDPVIERTVAIKVLHPHHCQGPRGEELSKRFQREAQAAARCLHSNIVTVFDYGSQQQQDFIVMEYIEGEELSHFLRSEDKLSVDEALFITTSVLQALTAAHEKNIVHRDIKPANIILLNSGEVKVADFGVALLDQSDLTLVGNMVGTPNYMSPEGLRGEVVTCQADIYSTGMVLLEMLTGARLSPQQLYTLPIAEFLDSVFEQHQHLPGDLQAIVRKALEPLKEHRYYSAVDFKRAIESLATLQQNAVATVIAKTSIQSKSQQLLKLPAATLANIENNLAGYLGPMANLLIKKTSTHTDSAEAFMLELSEHISNAQERQEFIRQASKTLAISSATSAVKVVSSSDNQPLPKQSISSEQLETISLALAYSLGPVARHQVKRYLKRFDNYPLLCEQLANLITDEQERKDFLRKTLLTK
ncbi:MAG: serine/threonine protein kinase [Pseudomonadales bacterium]|nr:serine/threonine protein kinase [Pseudomonadales bacterium]NRA15004.1 serine/threonine protein kinase [Oceanospirillaceae bacterium]